MNEQHTIVNLPLAFISIYCLPGIEGPMCVIQWPVVWQVTASFIFHSTVTVLFYWQCCLLSIMKLCSIPKQHSGGKTSNGIMFSSANKHEGNFFFSFPTPTDLKQKRLCCFSVRFMQLQMSHTGAFQMFLRHSWLESKT